MISYVNFEQISRDIREVICKLFLLTFIFISSSCYGTPNPVSTFPRLPSTVLENHFQNVHKNVEDRSKQFLANQQFQPWTINKSEKEILDEVFSFIPML